MQRLISAQQWVEGGERGWHSTSDLRRHAKQVPVPDVSAEKTIPLAHECGPVRDIAEAASGWFWEQNSRLRFPSEPANLRQVPGTEPRELLGRTPVGILHGCAVGEQDDWRAHLITLEATKPVRDFSDTFLLPDGEMRVLSTSGRSLFNRRRCARHRGPQRGVNAQVSAAPRRGEAQKTAGGRVGGSTPYTAARHRDPANSRQVRTR